MRPPRHALWVHRRAVAGSSPLSSWPPRRQKTTNQWSWNRLPVLITSWLTNPNQFLLQGEPVTKSSCSYAHEGNGTTHSHQDNTFIPHLLASNTAASGLVADLQAWSNLAGLHIENVPPLYSAPGGPPTLHPLLFTQLWTGGNASSCSQQEMAHYPVSVPKTEHYYPIQTRSVRPHHWDIPIDSNLNMVSIVITACLRCSFANSTVED
jgi:hypothetical protein